MSHPLRHRLQAWWICSTHPQSGRCEDNSQKAVHEGTDSELLRILDRLEVTPADRMTVFIDMPNETAFEFSRWEAILRVDGNRSVARVNGGVWMIAVLPGQDGPSDEISFPDAKDGAVPETTDTLIPRGFGFQAIRSWLRGTNQAVADIEWDAESSRYNRYPRRKANSETPPRDFSS